MANHGPSYGLSRELEKKVSCSRPHVFLSLPRRFFGILFQSILEVTLSELCISLYYFAVNAPLILERDQVFRKSLKTIT